MIHEIYFVNTYHSEICMQIYLPTRMIDVWLYSFRYYYLYDVYIQGSPRGVLQGWATPLFLENSIHMLKAQQKNTLSQQKNM